MHKSIVLTSDKGQPLNKGQKTINGSQTCPLFGGSTVTRVEWKNTVKVMHEVQMGYLLMYKEIQ